MSSLALNFNEVNFDVVDRNGQPWLRASEIGKALGYADDKAIQRVYARNADEFTADMTGVVKMTTPAGSQESRVFSLRGCHLLAMFSRTAVAKQFRKWVLDILDREVEKARLTITPEQQAKLHEIVASRSGGERKVFAEMWARHNRHFKIAKYSQLLAVHFDDSVQYLETMDIKAKGGIAEKIAPVDVNAIQNCHGVLQYQLIDYQKKLEAEVKRLGGKMPDYPPFNPEQVATALMAEILQGKNMVLKMHYQGGFTLDLVPNDAVMIESNNIPDLVLRHDLVTKEQLPTIMQNAMARLVE